MAIREYGGNILGHEILDMTLGEMKNYISEWFSFPGVKMIADGNDASNRKVVIIEEKSGKVVFEYAFTDNEPVTDETLVSTSGILNEELRGLIAQGYMLDKMIESPTIFDESDQEPGQRQ